MSSGHEVNEKISYELIEGRCVTPGAEGQRTYGVRVNGPHGGEWPDVADDARAVELLLTRLRRERPERCHLPDIIEDYIGELADGAGIGERTMRRQLCDGCVH
mgnify:FL=1